jgi:hypothetical protein
MAIFKDTTINDTGFLRIASGTTAQRPPTPLVGMVRFNTTLGILEGYDGMGWVVLTEQPVTDLYSFTTATFTNGGQTGPFGPTVVQARDGLTGPEVNNWKNNASFFFTSDGIQIWTVPSTGNYRIEVWGARGGDVNGTRQGLGARMRGDFSLTQGQTIRIIVGQAGGDTVASGGGGGTYVFGNVTDTLPLIVAGGGGGYGDSSGVNGIGGQTGTSGTAGTGAGFAGGTSGNGGSAGTDSGWGGAGAGWLTDGTDGGIYGGIAYAPRNGAAGGNIFQCGGIWGGFGGGGGGGCNGAGGGGGYSGGGTSGGGGGSYNGGSNQSNTATTNNDHGRVTITKL